jgi:hypothetical protein
MTFLLCIRDKEKVLESDRGRILSNIYVTYTKIKGLSNTILCICAYDYIGMKCGARRKFVPRMFLLIALQSFTV